MRNDCNISKGYYYNLYNDLNLRIKQNENLLYKFKVDTL